MKKLVLLSLLSFSVVISNAQTLLLTGTSYFQNFDDLGSGLPTGWSCYNTATSTSLGTLDLTFSTATDWGTYFDTSDGTGCPTDVFGTGFKNSASNTNTSMCTASCSSQESAINRCLSVRQSSPSGSHPGYDPGASFTLHLSSTSGCSNVQLSFLLESLDLTSPRVSSWVVDYGIGATPSVFTPVAPTLGTLSTGGYTCAQDSIVVNFGTALNEVNTDVWIRISELVESTDSLGGDGDRTTTGIDDFTLTWTGTATTGVANVNATPSLALTALGISSSDEITLGYSTSVGGNYHLNICDMAGRNVYSEVVNVTTNGDQRIAVNGLNLAPGMYIAKLSNENSSAVARISVK